MNKIDNMKPKFGKSVLIGLTWGESICVAP